MFMNFLSALCICPLCIYIICEECHYLHNSYELTKKMSSDCCYLVVKSVANCSVVTITTICRRFQYQTATFTINNNCFIEYCIYSYALNFMNGEEGDDGVSPLAPSPHCMISTVWPLIELVMTYSSEKEDIVLMFVFTLWWPHTAKDVWYWSSELKAARYWCLFQGGTTRPSLPSPWYVSGGWRIS